MVSPVHFSSNEQTKLDNVFMEKTNVNVHAIVRSHMAWVELLRGKGVEVILETHDKVLKGFFFDLCCCLTLFRWRQIPSFLTTG
jgi:hypothetical protein